MAANKVFEFFLHDPKGVSVPPWDCVRVLDVDSIIARHQARLLRLEQKYEALSKCAEPKTKVGILWRTFRLWNLQSAACSLDQQRPLLLFSILHRSVWTLGVQGRGADGTFRALYLEEIRKMRDWVFAEERQVRVLLQEHPAGIGALA